jgi:hypothetical protein
MNDLMNNATQGASSSGEGRSSTGGNVQLDHNAIMQMLGYDVIYIGNINAMYSLES